MTSGRLKRFMALGAAAAALAGGAVLTSTGTASAAPHPGPGQHQGSGHQQRCHVEQGHWVRTWHPASRDRHGKSHPGYWTRTWISAHKVCQR
jgi:hypothetical protein